MKYLIISFAIIASFNACTTTTTTRPDGTKIVVNAQDPKVIKAIVKGISEVAAQAAIQAIEQQAQNQNGNP